MCHRAPVSFSLLPARDTKANCMPHGKNRWCEIDLNRLYPWLTKRRILMVRTREVRRTGRERERQTDRRKHRDGNKRGRTRAAESK